MFFAFRMSAADTTTGTTSAPWAAVLASMSTTSSAGTSSGCQQSNTTTGTTSAPSAAVLGDDLSQPDTLGTSSRASGTHPGGPAAYLQQFRGKGEGVPIQ